MENVIITETMLTIIVRNGSFRNSRSSVDGSGHCCWDAVFGLVGKSVEGQSCQDTEYCVEFHGRWILFSMAIYLSKSEKKYNRTIWYN